MAATHRWGTRQRQMSWAQRRPCCQPRQTGARRCGNHGWQPPRRNGCVATWGGRAGERHASCGGGAGHGPAAAHTQADRAGQRRADVNGSRAQPQVQSITVLLQHKRREKGRPGGRRGLKQNRRSPVKNRHTPLQITALLGIRVTGGCTPPRSLRPEANAVPRGWALPRAGPAPCCLSAVVQWLHCLGQLPRD